MSAQAGDVARVPPPLSVEQQLAVQYSIARAFAEAERLEDAAPVVLRELADAFGWQAAGLWVPENETLVCADVYVASDDLAPWEADARSRRFPAGVGLPADVWRTGQAIWVRDTNNDDRFVRKAIAQQVGLRHGFAFPVKARGRMAAVIELLAAEVRDVDRAQSALLEAVGHQLGSFIERLEARHAVAVSDARKSGILRAAVDAIVSADAHGRIVEFNEAAERMFGWPRDEAIGRTVSEVLIPDDLRADHLRGMKRYAATGEGHILNQRVRTWGRHADGTRIPVELTVTEVRLDDQPMFTAFIRDISREREAETARDRFLEILSHELRTPVTALYGGAKVLSRGDVDSDERRSYLADMAEEADRLYRLIEDLIVLARAERGALAISLEPVRLERIAERVVKQFAERSPEIEFRFEVGGEVEVRVEHAAAESLVRVLDRGVGIDPAEVNRLFEIDFRSPLSEGLAQGSGIGLFVSRWLVRGMGGRIWARAREDGGSEFGFALKVVDVDAGGGALAGARLTALPATESVTAAPDATAQ